MLLSWICWGLIVFVECGGEWIRGPCRLLVAKSRPLLLIVLSLCQHDITYRTFILAVWGLKSDSLSTRSCVYGLPAGQIMSDKNHYQTLLLHLPFLADSYKKGRFGSRIELIASKLLVNCQLVASKLPVNCLYRCDRVR